MHSQQTLLRILRTCRFTSTSAPTAGARSPAHCRSWPVIWGVLLPTCTWAVRSPSWRAWLRTSGSTGWSNEGSRLHLRPDPARRRLHRAGAPAPGVLETLRVAMHSGSKMPAATVPAAGRGHRAPLRRGLRHDRDRGPVTRTENADWTVGMPARDVYSSTGRPVHIADLTIVDPDGRELLPGETGQITVSLGHPVRRLLQAARAHRGVYLDGRLWTGDIGPRRGRATST